MTQRAGVPTHADRMRKQRQAKILGDFFGEYWWIVLLGAVIVFGLGFLTGRLTSPKIPTISQLTPPPLITPTRTSAPILQATVAPTATPTNLPTNTATLAPTSTPITIASATTRATWTPPPTATDAPWLSAPSEVTAWTEYWGAIPLPDEGGIVIIGKGWRMQSTTDLSKPADGPGVDHTWRFQVADKRQSAEKQKDMIESLNAFLLPFDRQVIKIQYEYTGSVGASPTFVITAGSKVWKNEGGIQVK